MSSWDRHVLLPPATVSTPPHLTVTSQVSPVTIRSGQPRHRPSRQATPPPAAHSKDCRPSTVPGLMSHGGKSKEKPAPKQQSQPASKRSQRFQRWPCCSLTKGPPFLSFVFTTSSSLLRLYLLPFFLPPSCPSPLIYHLYSQKTPYFFVSFCRQG